MDLFEPLCWWLWERHFEQRRVKKMLAERAKVVKSPEWEEAARWSLEQQAAYWGEPIYREDIKESMREPAR